MNNDVQVFSTVDQEQNTVREVLGTVFESRWLVMAFAFVCLLGGLLHVFVAQPIYRSDALLQVNLEASGVSAMQDFSDFISLFSSAALDTEVKVLTSRAVLAPVVDQLDLDVIAQPIYFPVVGAAIARSSASAAQSAGSWINTLEDDKVGSWIGFYGLDLHKYAWGNERVSVERFDVANTALGRTYTIVAGQAGHYQMFNSKGDLLARGMVGKPAKPCQVAGAPCTLLISSLKGAPGTEFTLSRLPRLDEVQNVAASLEVTETSGEDVGKVVPSGSIEISLSGHDPHKVATILSAVVATYLRQNAARKSAEAEKTLKYLEGQLPRVKAQMEQAEAILVRYRQERGEQGAVEVTDETQQIFDQIAILDSQITELKAQRNPLLGTYTPLFTARREHVADLNAQISGLEQQKKALQQQVKRLPDTQQGILRLTRDADVNRQLYTLLLNKVQQLKVVKAGNTGNVEVLDQPAIPTESAGPSKTLIVLIYLLLGTLLGTAAAFIRKNLLGTVKDPDVIEKEIGLPVYAVVPHSSKQVKIAKRIAKGGHRKGSRYGVLSARGEADVAVESLRGLRTWLNYAFLGAKNNVLLITGPGPGVGKSFVSVNLGSLLADGGKRTLLIDADLRKGHLHHHFNMKRRHGLSDAIAGNISFEQAIHATDIDNLCLIPTGSLPPNPSELLLHERFVSMIDKLSSEFDHVIVDSPPVLAVTDAAILGHLAGSALLVLKANKHHLREINESVKRLKRVDVNLRGVVFNDMTSNKFYGYGKYYGYAYSAYGE